MPLDLKWPLPPMDNVPRSWLMKSKITMAVVGLGLKIWAERLNTLNVYNRETLIEAVTKRDPERPLITVSNHHSCLDDPMLWASLPFGWVLRHHDRMRWVLTASDVCFSRPAHAAFMALGLCVPVVRRDGVYQRGVDDALARLNSAAAWVHVFAEGGINLHKEKVLRLKWGVGRLIAESAVTPLVIPLWHCGFDDVLPNTPPYIPRVGKKLTVLVGDPIEFGDLVQELRETNASPRASRQRLTDVVQEEFRVLKRRCEALHFGAERRDSEHQPEVWDTYTNVRRLWNEARARGKVTDADRAS